MSKQKSIDDQCLVTAYINGDEQALAKLIKMHQRKIYGFIYSYVNDLEKTDDIFQDTFCKVVHTLKSGNYCEKGKFLGFTLRIAHNIIMNNYRKEKQIQTIVNGVNNDGIEFDVFNQIIIDNDTAERRIELKQQRKEIRQLIAILPEIQREVVILRYYYKMSFEDIATLLGINKNTALGRMNYAIINLRKLIQNTSFANSKKSVCN
jgi:RNA polymerase sigma-70 factor (ECF subfamily)